MANYEGRTVSHGIVVNKETKAAIEKYCENFYFAMEDVDLSFVPTQDGKWEFGIWGYDHLNILPYYVDEETGGREPDYESNDCTEEFFEGLRQFVPDGEELVVQGIGMEKLRHISAWEAKISRDKIEYGGLKFA